MKRWMIALLPLVSTPVLAQPAPLGIWEPFFEFGPPGGNSIVAIHLIHLHTGKVVAITNHNNNGCDSACDGVPIPPGESNCVGKVYLWTPPPPGDPNTGNGPGIYETIPNCLNYVYCCGHSALADGRVLCAGSNWTQPSTDIFNPVTQAWLVGPNMAQPRYYPTNTTLPDGKVLVTFGTQGNGGPFVQIPEFYDPLGPSWAQVSINPREQGRYAYMFLLPDGNLAWVGGYDMYEGGILITPYSGSPTWHWGENALQQPQWPVDPPPTPPGNYASAVSYAPGMIMMCGGQQITGSEPIATTYLANLNNINPDNPGSWMVADDMHHARYYHNLVILPDGKVLAVGGQRSVSAPQWWVTEAELFDPADGSWTELLASNAEERRVLHSTAMLLPDGRVVSAGGNGMNTAQIFNPPYITIGAPRPVITSAPAFMHYGQPYTITYDNGPAATDVSKACLIRLAAVTHGFDQDQRRVPLNISQVASTNLTVIAPANGNIAASGYYMLFILNEYAKNQFAPCVMARYVQVGQ